MARTLILLIVLGALYGSPVAAHQMSCGIYASMTMQLNSRHGETRRNAGISLPAVVETWANVETGTWTMMLVYKSGVACLLAVGENWREFEPEMPGTDL